MMIIFSDVICYIRFSVLVSANSSSITYFWSLDETRKCFICWYINS